MQNKQTYQPPKPLNVEVSQIIISLQKNLLIWVSNFEVKEMLKKMKKLKSYNNNNSLFFASLASSSILYPTYEEHFMAHQKMKRQARLCLGFSLVCSRILPNICLSFHQAMKAQKTCFIS